jgi:hypothetical protein
VIFIGDLIFGVLDLGSLLHHRDVTLITRDCDDSMRGGRASLRGVAVSPLPGLQLQRKKRKAAL